MHFMFSRQMLSCFLVLLLVNLSACSGENKEAGEKKAETAAPGKVFVPAPPEIATIKGTVLEIADGGAFTFILLDRGDKKTWATVPPVDVKVGEEVTLRFANVFENFYSKGLDRKFDELIFSSGIEGKEIKTQAKHQSSGPDGVMGRRSMRLHAAAQATKSIGPSSKN